MQEEVENKTVNLAVKSTKVTATVLYKGLRAYVNHCQKKAAQKKVETKEPVKGKQSVKELIGQGQGVSSMPIGDKGIRDFKRICKKYGVDFAIVKDKNENPPVYTVFFKAKDADAIAGVLKEYSAKQMKKQEKKERPSILEKLKKFKDVVSKAPKKEKERRKEHER